MSKQDTSPLINEDDSLVSVKSQWDNPIPFYDDSFGPLWVFCNSLGVAGIVRAQSWESAYERVRDDILSPIPPEDVIEAYGYYTHPENPLDMENNKIWFACKGAGEKLGRFGSEEEANKFCLAQISLDPEGVDLREGYAYQGNATGSGIVMHDLNGESLDPLTMERIEKFGLKIETEDPDETRRVIGEGR